MPKNPNEDNLSYSYLLELLAKNKEKQQLADILNILMTDKEQQELSNRVRIFALLQQGTTQREISAELGVGIATVSRGAKIFQQHDIEKLFPDIEKAHRKRKSSQD